CLLKRATFSLDIYISSKVLLASTFNILTLFVTNSQQLIFAFINKIQSTSKFHSNYYNIYNL
ncbi:MAG: hypothetical protein E7H07_07820, partial [Staphylococcus epidermidis]|nr:hypothetical protein [Staphylococcus epidermidis]